MNIQEMKSVYTAGLEAVLEVGADEVRKHNRKRDVSLFMERGDYWVDFRGPSNVNCADGTHLKNVVTISVTYWHTMDLKEEGDKDFDDPNEAIKFLRMAVKNPAKAMKKMETWFED